MLSVIAAESFQRELGLIKGAAEKQAFRETLRVGGKAVRQALFGGTRLAAPTGVMLPQRQAAVGVGTRLMETLRKAGIKTHRARVKSPGSIQAGGHTTTPDDLLGMQGYAKNPQQVQTTLDTLKRMGVGDIKASAKTRPGYHGINIKGTYKGVPMEYQLSPSRISNAGQMMEHSLGYKQLTEAPKANWFDKWVGRSVAPRMVSAPSWIPGQLDALRAMGVAV